MTLMYTPVASFKRRCGEFARERVGAAFKRRGGFARARAIAALGAA